MISNKESEQYSNSKRDDEGEEDKGEHHQIGEHIRINTSRRKTATDIQFIQGCLKNHFVFYNLTESELYLFSNNLKSGLKGKIL